MKETDWLSIGTFSKIVGISSSALRYYDEIGLFRPAFYGDGETNKHRYYAPAQITSVKILRVLTELGLPIKVISNMMRERDPKKILRLLNEQKHVLSAEINRLREACSILDVFTGLLHESLAADKNDLSVQYMDGIPIVVGNVNEFFDGEESFYGAFLRFCKQKRTPSLNLCYPIGSIFDTMDTFAYARSQPTRFFSVDPIGKDKKEEGLYLVGYTNGYYGDAEDDLPERMFAYAKEKRLALKYPVYNLYLTDEVSETDPRNYLLQVSVPIAVE
jgi:DNA-binding transcriptional MerR regulator